VISAIQQYSGNIYFVKIDFSGTRIFPGGMNYYYKAVQFSVGLASGTAENWNMTNDWSFKNLSSSFTVSTNIPAYDNNVLVFGKEPGGITPTSTPTPTRTATMTATGTATVPVGLKGDVNNSGKVDIVDALMTAQYYIGLNPQGFTAANADVNGDASITIVDALMIAQYYVGLISW